MLEVIFLRHGQSEYNARGLIQGQRDCTLTDCGVEQARAASPRVASAHSSVAAVVSSDLSRAHDTARIIAHAMGVSCTTDARLRERALGCLEGLPRRELKCLEPRAFAAWMNKSPNAFVPPDGETIADIDARLRAFFIDTYRAHAGSGHKVLCVTHGGVLARLFSSGLNTRDRKLAHGARGVGNLGECVVYVHENGTWECAYDGWASTRFLDSHVIQSADDVAS